MIGALHLLSPVPLLPLLLSSLLISPPLGRAASHALLSGDEGASPLPGTPAFAQERGEELLAAENWDEAGEVYGGWNHLIPKGIKAVWDSKATSPQREQDRFRYDLINFFYEHMDSSAGWGSLPVKIWVLAERYPQWAKSVPEAQRSGELDFSQIDLFRTVLDRTWKEPFGPDMRDRVLSTLRANPDSIPARLAFKASLMWADRTARQEAEKLLTAGDEILTSASGRLWLARSSLPVSRYSVPHQTQERILAETWELAPSRGERAELLYRLAEVHDRMKPNIQVGPRRDAALEKPIASLIRVYETFPTTYAAEKARVLAARLLMYIGTPERALAEVRRLQTLGGHKPGLEVALFRIAHLMRNRKRFTECEPLLLEVIRDYPSSYWATSAKHELSRLSVDKGDPAKEREWLDACLEGSPGWAPAVKAIAEWNERADRWPVALRAWKDWRPRNFCGNGARADETRRVRGIDRCLRNMGEFSELVTMYAERLAKKNYLGSHPWAAGRLYDLYEAADQVEDLPAIAEAIEERLFAQIRAEREREGKSAMLTEAYWERTREWSGIRLLRRLVVVRDLTRKKDVIALVQFLVELPSEEPKVWQTVARAIAECSGSEVKHLKNEFNKTWKNDPESYEGKIWANEQRSRIIHALGRSKSPEALAFLSDLALGDRTELATHVTNALAMHGEAGKRVLENLAAREGKSTIIGHRASKTLASHQNGALEEPAPPRPAPGTLPHRIDIP